MKKFNFNTVFNNFYINEGINFQDLDDSDSDSTSIEGPAAIAQSYMENKWHTELESIAHIFLSDIMMFHENATNLFYFINKNILAFINPKDMKMLKNPNNPSADELAQIIAIYIKYHYQNNSIDIIVNDTLTSSYESHNGSYYNFQIITPIFYIITQKIQHKINSIYFMSPQPNTWFKLNNIYHIPNCKFLNNITTDIINKIPNIYIISHTLVIDTLHFEDYYSLALFIFKIKSTNPNIIIKTKNTSAASETPALFRNSFFKGRETYPSSKLITQLQKLTTQQLSNLLYKIELLDNSTPNNIQKLLKNKKSLTEGINFTDLDDNDSDSDNLNTIITNTLKPKLFIEILDKLYNKNILTCITLQQYNSFSGNKIIDHIYHPLQNELLTDIITEDKINDISNINFHFKNKEEYINTIQQLSIIKDLELPNTNLNLNFNKGKSGIHGLNMIEQLHGINKIFKTVKTLYIQYAVLYDLTDMPHTIEKIDICKCNLNSTKGLNIEPTTDISITVNKEIQFPNDWTDFPSKYGGTFTLNVYQDNITTNRLYIVNSLTSLKNFPDNIITNVNGHRGKANIINREDNIATRESIAERLRYLCKFEYPNEKKFNKIFGFLAKPHKKTNFNLY